MSFFLFTFQLKFPSGAQRSSATIYLPGLLRSDRGGLSVSSPSGEWKDAWGLRKWCKLLVLKFYWSPVKTKLLSLFSPLNFPAELSSFYYSLYLWWIFKLIADAVSPSNSLDQLGLDLSRKATSNIQRKPHMVISWFFSRNSAGQKGEAGYI